MPTPSVFLGRCRNAFTLVELLCVIAILALLANLIFPSLQNARNKALSIACSSNMRQIGVAVLLAAGDNDGRYPMIEGEPNGPNSTYPPGSGAVSLLTALQPYGGRDQHGQMPQRHGARREKAPSSPTAPAINGGLISTMS